MSSKNIKEENKYKAETFRTFGFAVMVPFAKAFLAFIEDFEIINEIHFQVNGVISFLLIFLGVRLIDMGRQVIEFN
ncbi:MAG: hypothetical protein HRT47_01950 [Candidatus Caenarcaniphilales bacterium]|nr:hypothetical protein [Candidatus Caenarcaniphilales bacterium]